MNLNRQLILSGSLFTVVLFLWPVVMLLAQPGGTPVEQLDWIAGHLALHRIQYLLAAFIGPMTLYMMLVQQEKMSLSGTLARRLGWLFLTVYLALVSMAYLAQVVLLPGLLSEGYSVAAGICYFNAPASISYFLDQLGYCFWGIGVLILFIPFIRSKGIPRVLGWLYLFSGLLSILAFLGLVMESKTMNTLTLYSGLALLPAGILTAIWGVREQSRNRTS